MNEEATFLEAILADPDDAASVQVYADWLEEQGDPRGDYLRLELASGGKSLQQAASRGQFDPAWLAMIESRRFRIGDLVKITAGVCEGMEATILSMAPRRGCAGLWLHILGRQTEPLEVEFPHLRLLRREATRKRS